MKKYPRAKHFVESQMTNWKAYSQHKSYKDLLQINKK